MPTNSHSAFGRATGISSCNTGCRRPSLRKTVAVAVILLAGISQSPSAVAQKTDYVYLKNGDRLTVEVKELSRGQMRLSTNAFGTIYVKWEDVERIETSKRLQIELVNGRRFFGPAQVSKEPGVVALQVDGEVLSFDNDRIVRIQPIKGFRGLQGNLDNTLSLGLSYTQASDVLQWNVSASTRYQTEKFVAAASYNSMITRNALGTDSAQRDLHGTYLRLLRNRWLWFATTGLQQNDELGVSGRFIAGGGLGRIMAQSQKHEFILAAGLNANVEDALGSTDVTPAESGSGTTLEGLIFGEWTYYKLYSPKANVSISGSLYPGITESDRFRGDVRLRYRQEFVKDLFLNVTYYLNFDTRPRAGALSESDYGVVTALEYEF